MELADTIARMKALRHHITGTVGFVPTMGFLHEGHLSLVKKAKAENSIVVVSIFVNPTQFGPTEDFKTYPRNLERDLSLLEKAHTDVVFVPSKEEMYPTGFNSWVEVQELTDKLEGKSRPGHFKGVTTVVAKLFNIVKPSRAYFGQKDAQQALVIQKMVADLNMNLEIVVCPTMREKDGLAMSSRNTYLNSQEREAASILFKALTRAEQMREKGESKAERLRQEVIALIKEEPLATIEYVSVADIQTLEELTEISKSALVSIAIRIGKTRLIDNIVLK
jgi:pantoate--beta-alanine ligase